MEATANSKAGSARRAKAAEGECGGGAAEQSSGELLHVRVTSQFSSLLKEMQGNPLEHSPLSKSEIFFIEYSRISNK